MSSTRDMIILYIMLSTCDMITLFAVFASPPPSSVMATRLMAAVTGMMRPSATLRD